jgi:hypothetical protein
MKRVKRGIRRPATCAKPCEGEAYRIYYRCEHCRRTWYRMVYRRELRNSRIPSLG